MKLRVTLSVDVEITDLAHYDAATLEEAVRNQALWYGDGTASVGEDMSYGRFVAGFVSGFDDSDNCVHSAEITLTQED